MMTFCRNWNCHKLQPAHSDHNLISPIEHQKGKNKRSLDTDPRINEAFTI